MTGTRPPAAHEHTGAGSDEPTPLPAARSATHGDPITVLLADDQELVRAGFRMLLAAQDDIRVVGEAATGAETISLVREARPQVVLMDIRMPVLDGVEATRQIAATPGLAGVRVLILTTYDTDEYVHEALQAGASGFLLKDCGPTELLHGIHVVAAGEALLAPPVTRRLIAQFTASRTRRHRGEEMLRPLTQREQEVLALVGQGLSNNEIAARLTLSPATVRTHVGRLLAKLNARDRAQLVVAAYETGLVVPGG
ncbi:response regulator [Micromonospora sp. MS34]|uniref:response regulator n=1 Tax=Micromonospora sp. MS34 TaxID=3385971 RepID=UPI0039A1F3F0